MVTWRNGLRLRDCDAHVLDIATAANGSVFRSGFRVGGFVGLVL